MRRRVCARSTGRVARRGRATDTWDGLTGTGRRWRRAFTGRACGLSRVKSREGQQFRGFKGFGVCRDLDGIIRLDALRRLRADTGARAARHSAMWASGSEPEAPPPPDRARRPHLSLNLTRTLKRREFTQASLEHPWKRLQVVRSARPAISDTGDKRSPSDQDRRPLTPVENSAFKESPGKLC